MKRLIVPSLILIVAAALGYYFFSMSGTMFRPSSGKGDMDKGNNLRVIVESNYPPYVYTSSDGKVNGFEIDLIQEICSRIKRTCEFDSQDWSKIIISVQKGQYDLGVGGISITEKRKKEVDFAEPYVFPHGRFFANLTKHKALKNIKTLDQFNQYLKTNQFVIGVQSATTLDEFVTKELTSTKILRYEAASRLAIDLSYGRVDAIFIEIGTEGDFFNAMGSKKSDYGFFGPKIDGNYHPSFASGISMIIRKDIGAIKGEINKVIKDLQNSGFIKILSEKHFGYDLSSNKSK